jgi:Apea-like HEPN
MMRIDQKAIRSALVAAVEADKSKTFIGTPSDEAREMVRLALEAEHDLREVSISNGQSSSRFDVWTAPILLQRAHYGGGINDALAWLDRILQIRQSDFYIVMPLWGLKLEQSLDLTEQVRLLPVTEFYESNNLRQFLQPFSGSLPIYRWKAPESVLLKRQTFPSVFVKVGEIAEIDLKVLEQLHDIRNCLALAGPVALAGDIQWIEFINPDLSDFNSGTWSRAQEIQAHNLDFGSFDPELAKALVPGFINLTGEDRNKIYLASDRFTRALWRHDAGEAALELGITLDSLLGDGAGELVFKVGLRAALLIGGDLPDRQRRREIVKSAYDLRSKVVHTGKADKTFKFKGQNMPTKDFVELAIGVTAEVVRKIIILGKIPNWNDVELSGQV